MLSVKNWIKALAISSAAMVTAQTASAEIVTGIAYQSADIEDSGVDIRLGLVSATVGYKFATSASNFSITPEFRLGTGISDDKDLGITVKAKRFYGANVRAQWDLSNNAYLYAAPSYTNFEFEASTANLKLREDDWEFGGAIGAGYKLSSNLNLELTYEMFDNADLLGVGARYSF